MVKVSSVQILKEGGKLSALVDVAREGDVKKISIPLIPLGDNNLHKGEGAVSFRSLVEEEEDEFYRDDWSGKLQSSTSRVTREVWTKVFVQIALDGRSGQIFCDSAEDLTTLRASLRAIEARRAADEAAQKETLASWVEKFNPRGASFIISPEVGERIDVSAIGGEVYATYYRSHNANGRKWRGTAITSRDLSREEWLRWLVQAGFPTK